MPRRLGGHEGSSSCSVAADEANPMPRVALQVGAAVRGAAAISPVAAPFIFRSAAGPGRPQVRVTVKRTPSAVHLNVPGA